MSERNYYVLCDDKCLFPGMTREQTLAAIAEATGSTPTSIDDAFITKIKEQNRNGALKFWIGTQAEYNAIESPEANCFYIFTDSDELSEVEQLARDTAEDVVKHFNKVLYDGQRVSNASGAISLTVEGLSDYNIILIDGVLFTRQGTKFHSSTNDIDSSYATYSSTTFSVSGNVLSCTIWTDYDNPASCTAIYDPNNETTTINYSEVSFSKIIGIM